MGTPDMTLKYVQLVCHSAGCLVAIPRLVARTDVMGLLKPLIAICRRRPVQSQRDACSQGEAWLAVTALKSSDIAKMEIELPISCKIVSNEPDLKVWLGLWPNPKAATLLTLDGTEEIS